MFKELISLNKKLLIYHFIVTLTFHLGLLMILSDGLLNSVPVILFILCIHNIPYLIKIFNNKQVKLIEYIALEVLLIIEFFVIFICLTVPLVSLSW